MSVDVATSPEVATDGQFLDENIADSDYLTDNEIQSGHWLAQDQIDPGTYYVMLDASADPIQCTRPDFSTDPSCADGTSNIRRVKVPTPVTHYAATTHLYTFVNTIELTLTARPLGDKEPYEVCWKDKARQTKCLKGTLNGYDWDSSADDELMTTTKGLAPRTKFTWTRTGRHPKRLVAKTVRTPTSKF